MVLSQNSSYSMDSTPSENIPTSPSENETRTYTSLLYQIKTPEIPQPCKGELDDLALNGRIPGKRARGAQRFIFINNFKHL